MSRVNRNVKTSNDHFKVKTLVRWGNPLFNAKVDSRTLFIRINKLRSI